MLRERNATHSDDYAPGSLQATLDCVRILSALRSAVVVVDEQGKVLQANARAAALLARDDQPLRGLDIALILAPMDLIRDSARGETEERARAEIKGPDGAPRRLGFQAADVGTKEAPAYAVIFQDITPYERLRAERDRLMQIAGVSEVLPAVLHELKNPLAAIDSAVELMIEEASDSRVGEELHAILGEIRRMKLTLEGLGSMDREIHATRFAAIDLALEETARVMSRQAGPRDITLRVDVPALPLLPFDPAVVRAIAFNLVTNALHACRAGDRIDVAARIVNGGKSLELVVKDTGAGMTPEVLERCRELFFTTKAKGSGIGLALVSDIVGRAGGHLEIVSALRDGTNIRLTVPLERPRRSNPPPGLGTQR
jgi:signal transduction histidine kinase